VFILSERPSPIVEFSSKFDSKPAHESGVDREFPATSERLILLAYRVEILALSLRPGEAADFKSL
jgi:hypothetical protein